MRRVFKLCVVLLLIAVMSNVGSVLAGYDLDGRTVRISSQTPDITPFAPRGQETFLEPHGRLLAHIQAVEERFNVKLEFYRNASTTAHLTDLPPQVIAGETDYDVYMMRRTEMIPLARQGFLWPLNDFLGSDYRDKLSPMFRSLDYTDFQGRTYLLNTFKFPPTVVGILWNKDLFEELDLPNLYELVDAGEWTWDALRNIALQGVLDTTGDGEINMWGINDGHTYSTGQAGSLITEFALTNNAHWVTEQDGRVVVSFDNPAFLEAAQFVADLKQAQGTPTRGGWDQYLQFSRGNYLMNAYAMRALDWPDLINADFSIGVVPLPMGPRATEYVYPDWSLWGMAIPITVKEPAAIAEIINQLYLITSDYIDVDEWQEDFLAQQVAQWVHDRESYDTILTSFTRATTASPYFADINTPELRAAIASVLADDKTAAVAFGEIRYLIQELLDDTYNN